MNNTDPFQQALHHHHAGQLAEARAAYERCLALSPNSPNTPHALTNLGSVCRRLGDLPAARDYLHRAIAVTPNDAVAHYNLGNLNGQEGKSNEAIANYRASLALPAGAAQHARTAYNLGLVLGQIGEIAQAELAYRYALAQDANHYEAKLNLATVLAVRGLITEAHQLGIELLAVQPNDSRVINNLANLEQDQGQIDAALALLRRAIALEPDRPQPRSNELLTLQYQPGISTDDIKAAAQAWGQWASARAQRILGRTPGRRFLTKPPGCPLRIGYVSGDLSLHPVGLYLQGVMEAHDPKQVIPVLYSNGSLRDDISASLIQSAQAKGGGFREVKDLDDLTLARQIEADEIDILVDLSGHTGKPRLAMFALRPASVQITWLGYFATTGLPAIDFIVADPYQAPEGSEAQFTERVLRLPHNRFCYRPVPFAPDVTPPPCQSRGYITFGSYNNTAKLNDAVLATWADILNAVPHSRLILKWRTFADANYRTHITTFFTVKGIDPARIELRPMSIHRELLAEYADIDIALDPFPFSGGQTSCETLWMGIPIITWAQDRMVSRQTLSFLVHLNLADLAVTDRAAYIAKAVALANDPPRLIRLRETLRDTFRSSVLCDVARFTRDLEAGYRLMWNQIRTECALASAKRGIALRAAGASVEARIDAYREAVNLAPEIGLYAANLASALGDAQQFEEAEHYARQAIETSPERFETWFNLGIALAGQNRITEAAAAYAQSAQRIEDTRPVLPDPACPLVVILQGAGQAWSRGREPLRAAQCFKAALDAHGPSPTDARAHLLGAFGETLAALYKHPEAEAAFREALAITPDDPGQLTNLGNILAAQRRYDGARQCYERVLALDPKLAGAYSNLGTVWQSLGDNDRAIDWHRQALDRDPTLVPVWSNLAAAMTYSLTRSPAEVRSALSEFDEKVARPLHDAQPHGNDPNPQRRLKIGYVSPDFRKHAVAYFALPLLEGHNKAQVEVFCYHNHLQNDEWTTRFKSAADHWRVAVAMSDAQLATQIRADGIDILIDLAGHTENNRLLTFAMKPAPVQVTWMGYVTTTGMTAMDWRITHADADPAGCDADYAEKLVRLPGTMWCYRPLPDMPAVSPAPTFTKGHITFGSFNRYSKNSTAVLAAWADILNRVKDSRLLICVPEGEIRQQMAQFFNERGIDPARIDAFAKVDHPTFWKLHGEVDIALDPFPFGGGTTTCETLWLGVPLITCTGKAGGDFAPRFASRMGYAFLNNIGHPELAADSIADYIDKAVALANDRERLTTLRQILRNQMASAPLTDEKRFVQEMETAYRSMWLEWLQQHPN